MLKRAVIKEELVELTGDMTKAVLLNQFIYWSERIRDFDKFIDEEVERMKNNEQDPEIEKQYGWIYKTAEELSEETMLGVTPRTVRRHLSELVESEWLEERRNPKYKWDRTLQYRVDIKKIQSDLLEIGYFLEGYRVNLSERLILCNGQKGRFEETKKTVQEVENVRTIPESTTEITKEIKNSDSDSSEIELEEQFEQLWKLYPNKKGKRNALKKFKQEIKAGTTYSEIEQGIKNYVKEIEYKGTKKQYIKHGGTWFNQAGWLDEYEFRNKAKEKEKRQGQSVDDIQNMLLGKD